MSHGTYTQDDFGRSPLMFYYEVTLACDLVCKHCRASAQEHADPGELSTDEAKALIEQAAEFPSPADDGPNRRRSAETQGPFRVDPPRRARGIEVALTPSATPLATREAFEQARDAGVRRLGISLDGADAANARRLSRLGGQFRPHAGNAAKRPGFEPRRANKHHHYTAQRASSRRHRRVARRPGNRHVVGFLSDPSGPRRGRRANNARRNTN